MHPLRLQTNYSAFATIVAAHGTLDIASTPRLRRVLMRQVDDGVQHLVVDLSAVEFMDSSALGVFILVRNRLHQQRGNLQAVAARGSVLRLLEMTDTAELLGAHQTVQQATADHIRPPPVPAAGPAAGAEALLRVRGQLPADAAGRDELRAEAIELSAPWATRLARRFYGHGEATDDLDQVATEGVIKAVDRYDPARGSGFAAFAIPTVLGEIRRYFRDRGWRVRVPRAVQELRLAIKEATADLAQQLGRTPNGEDLASYLRVPVDEVRGALQAGSAYLPRSLTEPAGPGGDKTLADQLAVTDDRLDLIDAWQSVRPLLDRLPLRERRILRLRFVDDLSQSQIADKLGISQMHVSRLLAGTLRQLRAAMPAG